MGTTPFTLSGDDPVIPADIVDPSVTQTTDPNSIIDSGYMDPIANTSALDSSAPNPFVYGVTGGLVGPPTSSGSYDLYNSDPSAKNSSPTTAVQAGTSILDSILKLGTLSLGVTTAVTQRGGAVANNARVQSNPVTASKTTGGTSSGLLWFAVALFIGIFLFLEFNH